MNFHSCKILKIFQGPWESKEGVDMPGVAGPTWHYADLFLQMENNQILRIVCGETGVVETLPKDTTRIKDKQLRKIEGKHSIVNIYIGDDNPLIYILLDDGSHLEYSLKPGGSYWGIDRFDEWSRDDLEEDQLEETFTSFIDGRSQSWSQLIKWYKN